MRPGRVIGAVVVGTAVALLLFALGIEPVFAIAWGLVAVAVAAVVLLRSAVHDDDPPRIPLPSERAGRRTEVRATAWGIDGHRGVVGGGVQRRAHELTVSVLHRAGIDPDDADSAPLIEGLLGPAAVALLRGDALTPSGLDELLAGIEKEQGDA